MKFHGIVVPIATPVTRDEKVDRKGLQRLTAYLLEGGVHGVFVMGSMGRAAFFSDEQQAVAVEAVVDKVNGKVPVMAGVSDTGISRIIPKIRACEKAGVDALVILPPFYYGHNQTEQVAFFRAVASETDLPIILYNNSSLFSNALKVESVVALSEVRNIVGIKDSGQNFTTSLALIRAFFGRKDFSVFMGTETFCFEALVLGADGVNAGSHNLAPRMAVQLYDAVRQHRLDQARKLQAELAEIDSIYRMTNTLAGLEVAMQTLGIFDKAVIRPHAPIKDAAVKARIQKIVRKYLVPS